MNIGEPWPDLYEAEQRVLGIQAKLHQWAADSPKRRFDDIYNLVYDPAVFASCLAAGPGQPGGDVGRS